MKNFSVLMSLLLCTSCGKIQRILDGTENLPNQIQETNDGMKKTNEGIRMQKIGESLKILLDENNRKTLAPIPSNMMSASKVLSEALNAEEAVLFIKNYLIKVNEETFEDTYAYVVGTPDEEKYRYIFLNNKMADLLMVQLVSGFLPEQTLTQIIKNESEQGAYREILFQSLKMRSDFYSQLMLKAGLLDGDRKLDTLGKIEKSIEYAEKLDAIYKLEFAEKIELKIIGFSEAMNKRLSKPLDKELPRKIWDSIYKKAQEDFKAQSFSQDENKNKQLMAEYGRKHGAYLEKIKTKMEAYPAVSN